MSNIFHPLPKVFERDGVRGRENLLQQVFPSPQTIPHLKKLQIQNLFASGDYKFEAVFFEG